MNDIIAQIIDHRSVRSFKDQELTKEEIHTIVKAAQAASTSSLLQAYTILGITDKEKKAKLAELAGNQSYVEHNGHLFVFCSDAHRLEIASQMEGVDLGDTLSSTENFMITVIDAALAAQNASIAAESMGLGICYIGGLRNNLYEVSKLLSIPKHVIPLFGLVVGHPAQMVDKKPRLPMELVYHENGYQTNAVETRKQLEQYNAIISTYYQERTNGKRADRWTSQIAQMLTQKSRAYMKEYVQSKDMNIQ